MNAPTPEAVRAALAYVERSRDGWFFEIQPFREGCETSEDSAARILAAALRQEQDNSTVIGRWTQAAPTEAGLYWLWFGDEDSEPFPVTVMANEIEAWVATGQWGWNRPQSMDEMTNCWWMPVSIPLRPPF